MNSIKNKLWTACQISAVIMVFAAPISRALFNLSAAAFLMLWFASGNFKEKIQIVQDHPITKPVLLFVLLMLIGILYTVAPAHDVIEHVRVYSKFILILMFLPVFSETLWRHRAFAGFMLAMLITVVLTYYNIWFDPSWSRTSNQGFGVDHSVFVDYIVQGVATSIFIGFCAFKLIAEPRLAWKCGWGIVIAMSLFSLVFLIQGRSGQFTLLAVFLLVVAVALSPKHRAIVSVAGLGLIIGLVYFSPIMIERMMAAYSDVQMFFQGQKNTSVGLRMHMWQFTFASMLEKPLIGYGTGAYHIMAEQYFGHCNYTCFHPHNQYLFFGMEHGVAGLLFYLWILWVVFVATRNMPRLDASFMLCILVVLIVDGLANAPLWYRMESYIFYTLLGVGLAAYSKPKNAVQGG